MTQRFAKIIVITVFISVCTIVSADEKPVYGSDDRLEILHSDTITCQVARSTVAIFPESEFSNTSGNRWMVRGTETLGHKGWCADERFSNQLSLVNCSGFLIASDRIVTAAHCINATDDPYGPGLNCAGLILVFDYQIADDGELPVVYSSEQVRRCSVVLDGEEVSGGKDWRVIQLDQSVARHPLTLMISDTLPALGESMTVVGHPLGLPMKSARNGSIRNDTQEKSFVLNIDSYEGNSGSAVFVDAGGTPLVVGMLTSGSLDFEQTDQSCRRSRVCNDGECGGETVTRSSAFSAWAEITNPVAVEASDSSVVLSEACL